MPEVSKSKKNESFLRKRAMIAAWQALTGTRECGHPKQPKFVFTFADTVSITVAAKAAGISPKLHYQWLKSDVVYRNAWEMVQDQAAQTLEDEAVRRAVEGVKRVRTHQGRPIKIGRKTLYDTEYDSQLMTLLLKRYRPALYRERTETQVTGSLEIIDRLQAGRKRLLEMTPNDGSIAS